MSNPFAGLVPDFSVFGADFTTWWQKLFAALWAVCIIVAGAALLIALLQMRKATNNNIPGQADEAKSHAIWAGGSLGVLAGAGVVLGAIITVAGS
jgi:hypothetical protein